MYGTTVHSSENLATWSHKNKKYINQEHKIGPGWSYLVWLYTSISPWRCSPPEGSHQTRWAPQCPRTECRRPTLGPPPLPPSPRYDTPSAGRGGEQESSSTYFTLLYGTLLGLDLWLLYYGANAGSVSPDRWTLLLSGQSPLPLLGPSCSVTLRRPCLLCLCSVNDSLSPYFL